MRASMEKGGLGMVNLLAAAASDEAAAEAAAAAAMEEAMVAALTGMAAPPMPTPMEVADSLVEVVQSLETDFLPSECVGETGKT